MDFLGRTELYACLIKSVSLPADLFPTQLTVSRAGVERGNVALPQVHCESFTLRVGHRVLHHARARPLVVFRCGMNASYQVCVLVS